MCGFVVGGTFHKCIVCLGKMPEIKRADACRGEIGGLDGSGRTKYNKNQTSLCCSLHLLPQRIVGGKSISLGPVDKFNRPRVVEYIIFKAVKNALSAYDQNVSAIPYAPDALKKRRAVLLVDRSLRKQRNI